MIPSPERVSFIQTLFALRPELLWRLNEQELAMIYRHFRKHPSTLAQTLNADAK